MYKEKNELPFREEDVLCGANSYCQKFYLNQRFCNLPSQVKDELQMMCVLYTEDVGGILTVYFDEDGNLMFEVRSEENDFFFDEIGSYLKIKQIRQERAELLEMLEQYYKAVFLLKEEDGENPE